MFMWSRPKGITLAASAASGLIIADRLAEYTKPKESDKTERINALVQKHMTTHGIPGLSVGATIDGVPVYSAGFGFSNVELGAKCHHDTVMRIASISKSITSVIVARLVDSGKLCLDKSIQDFLPEFPTKYIDGEKQTISTRHLLSHTGGIRHYKEEKDKRLQEFLSNTPYEDVSSALKMFQDDPLVNKPGEKFSYTTHGYTLVSAVAEKVSGTAFTKEVKRLFNLIGMRNTSLDTNPNIIYNRASYYAREKGVLRNCQQVDNSYKWAGGGILSNVPDLLTFANAVLYSYQFDSPNTLIKQTTLREFWKPHFDVSDATQMALGWFRIDRSNVGGVIKGTSTQYYHTGAAVGASSVLLVSPMSNNEQCLSGVCVAILCNLQDTCLLNLARDIGQILQEN